MHSKFENSYFRGIQHLVFYGAMEMTALKKHPTFPYRFSLIISAHLISLPWTSLIIITQFGMLPFISFYYNLISKPCNYVF